jgi:hypothetical protein
MPSASGLLGDTTNLANATTSTLMPEQAVPGIEAQGLIVTLMCMAGALFVFAAINSLSRTAAVKVRKR